MNNLLITIIPIYVSLVGWAGQVPAASNGNKVVGSDENNYGCIRSTGYF
jgi:hypothetical protein